MWIVLEALPRQREIESTVGMIEFVAETHNVDAGRLRQVDADVVPRSAEHLAD